MDAKAIWEAAKMAAELLTMAGVERGDITISCRLTEAEVAEFAALAGVKVGSFASVPSPGNEARDPACVIYSFDADVGGVRVHGQGVRSATAADLAEGAHQSTWRDLTPDEARAALGVAP